MPQFDEKHVKINGCFIVWDGITRPDTGPDNKPKYSLKVVVPPNSPDMQLYGQLSNQALQESKWKGVLPSGARMPIGTARPDEFNGMFNGFAVLNCNSQRLPDVYDEAGQRLEPMQYSQLLYGGQQVDVLVHCYEYDKAGNKGIATGLDGFSIIVSANAQRQQFGNAGIDTSGAFNGSQQGNQNRGGGGGQPVQYDPNTGQPIAQNNAPVQYDPNTGQPIAQNNAPVQYDPNTGQPIQNGSQPQQAHNFLPNQ
jgi:hypothetical protein